MGQSLKLASLVDEAVGRCHRLNGRECEQTLGDSEGREVWWAAVLWGHRVRHSLVAEEQQQLL